MWISKLYYYQSNRPNHRKVSNSANGGRNERLGGWLDTDDTIVGELVGEVDSKKYTKAARSNSSRDVSLYY